MHTHIDTKTIKTMFFLVFNRIVLSLPRQMFKISYSIAQHHTNKRPRTNMDKWIVSLDTNITKKGRGFSPPFPISLKIA
ncbi:MAG TPA: hypothetical protein DCX22_02800 [Dehalococcoidia bacterium]|nr:hypothetical protein [Dehalococcoidia bacterium]